MDRGGNKNSLLSPRGGVKITTARHLGDDTKRMFIPPLDSITTAVRKVSAIRQELHEIDPPYGYETLDIEDQKEELVLGTVTEVADIAGEGGLRHIEVKKAGQTHINAIFLGFQQNVSIDSLLSILFNDNQTRKIHIQDAYINPRMPVAQLHEKWERKEDTKEAVCQPALVVQVATKLFLVRKQTTVIESLSHIKMNGGSEVMGALFPFLVSPMSNTIDLSIISKIRANGGDMTASLEGEAGSVQRLSIGASSGYSSKAVECVVDTGSQSPHHKPLPRVAIQLFTPEDIRMEDEWSSPVPPKLSSGDPEVSTQLNDMFKYLYRLHAPKDRPVTHSDTPSELRLTSTKGLNNNCVIYKCIAIGYTEKIYLYDMLRLYLVNPNQIKDVYFDFTIKPRDLKVSPGGLVVEIQVNMQDLAKKKNTKTTTGLIRLVAIPQQKSAQEISVGELSDILPPTEIPTLPPPPPPPPPPFKLKVTPQATIVSIPNENAAAIPPRKRKLEDQVITTGGGNAIPKDESSYAEPPVLTLDQTPVTVAVISSSSPLPDNSNLAQEVTSNAQKKAKVDPLSTTTSIQSEDVQMKENLDQDRLQKPKSRIDWLKFWRKK